jgi:hypothetical protein
VSHRFTVSLHRIAAGSDKFADRGDHLDWFFQKPAGADGALWTFSTPPELPALAEYPATRLPDHRHRYLDYDGEISGDRGSVQRLVTGTYRLVDNLVDNHDARFAFAVESVRLLSDGQLADNLMRAIKGCTTLVY